MEYLKLILTCLVGQQLLLIHAKDYELVVLLQNGIVVLQSNETVRINFQFHGKLGSSSSCLLGL